MLAIKLLNLLRTDEELKVIADQITADPIMTFKLLRYLNSPAIGLQNPILTIDKALLILGRERCFRWLSLLLFDIKQSNFRERLLTEQALTRAFFWKAWRGWVKSQRPKMRCSFLGLFSMLDLLMGMPMAELLEQTQLPQSFAPRPAGAAQRIFSAAGTGQSRGQAACRKNPAIGRRLWCQCPANSGAHHRSPEQSPHHHVFARRLAPVRRTCCMAHAEF